MFAMLCNEVSVCTCIKPPRGTTIANVCAHVMCVYVLHVCMYNSVYIVCMCLCLCVHLGMCVGL